MIMIVNAAAGGMYPLWKFFDAWYRLSFVIGKATVAILTLLLCHQGGE